MNIVEQTGRNAGIVYRFLEANGEASVKTISREAGLKESEIQHAIGWLAREGNISSARGSRNSVLYSLAKICA